jgi:creatinine amidohydrolase
VAGEWAQDCGPARQCIESLRGGQEVEKIWLQEMTSPEVEQVRQRTDFVLMPVGATEQHGPHLPLGTDTYIPMYAAEEIARRTGVPIAPPIWFSTSEMHMGFSGTISLRPSTMMVLLKDVCASLGRHGFRNFILLNGHQQGANPALLCGAEEIQNECPDLKVWVVDLMSMARTAVLEVCETDYLVHGEEIEVSNMLVAKPELVQLDLAHNVVPQSRSEFIVFDTRSSHDRILYRRTAEDWRQLTEYGNIGDPTKGTKEKGVRLMEALVSNTVAFITDLRRKS